MAKLKLSEKLALGNDLSDLDDLKVNRAVVLFCIFMVSSVTWALCTFMMKAVLYANHFLLNSLSQEQIFSQNNLIFTFIIVFFAAIRSFLYQFSWFSDAFGDGSSEALKHFHKTYQANQKPEDILKRSYQKGTFAVSIRRMIITIMTLGVGGSGGTEGPAIPLGQHIGTGFAKLMRVSDLFTLRVLEMCGISAAITTLLHAPLTGAIFALELVFACKFVYRLLICSLTSSLIAFILSNHIMDAHALFTIAEHSIKYTPYEYLMVTLVTIFVSIPSGIGLVLIFSLIRRCFARIPTILHAPIGALLCAIVAILAYHYLGLSPTHILGIGEETLINLFEHPEERLAVLTNWKFLALIVVLKLFLTGFTIISGGSAGLLIPAVFVGATSSAALYQFLLTTQLVTVLDGLDTLFMVTGIASSLVCIMDLPIATVILVGELFDVSFIPPCILAIAISRILSRKFREFMGE